MLLKEIKLPLWVLPYLNIPFGKNTKSKQSQQRTIGITRYLKECRNNTMSLIALKIRIAKTKTTEKPTCTHFLVCIVVVLFSALYLENLHKKEVVSEVSAESH